MVLGVLKGNSKFNSPFAQSAKKHGYRFNGGKSDDITVVVGQVAEMNSK